MCCIQRTHTHTRAHSHTLAHREDRKLCAHASALSRSPVVSHPSSSSSLSLCGFMANGRTDGRALQIGAVGWWWYAIRKWAPDWATAHANSDKYAQFMRFVPANAAARINYTPKCSGECFVRPPVTRIAIPKKKKTARQLNSVCIYIRISICLIVSGCVG